MSTSVSQDEAFGRDFLDKIVDWIPSKLDPGDVFSEGALIKWAREMGIKNIFEIDEVESYLDDRGKKVVEIE
jgi:hypothetical protein